MKSTAEVLFLLFSVIAIQPQTAALPVVNAAQGPTPPLSPSNADTSEDRLEMFNRVASEISTELRGVRERRGPYAELNALRAVRGRYEAQGEVAQEVVATMLLTTSAEIGNYADAIRYGDFGTDKYPLDAAGAGNALDGYRWADALAAITRAARSSQVVMINEAHHVPQHRAFTIALLKSLKREGYNYFAAETLFELDTGTALNERGYPVRRTGAYTKEPVFGDLIRTAIALGFRVIAYEPPVKKSADQRERDQARNLLARTVAGDSKARVVVHVGYGHNSEATLPDGRKLMAGYFKEFSGLDPLTIDQTSMTERSAPEYEHPLYRHVTARGLTAKAAVFQNRAGGFFTLPVPERWRDITVFHPRSVYMDGRPTWLRLGGERRAYRLPRDICDASPICLVSARVARESADAIPIDNVEVRPGEPMPALMLPRGEFIVEVIDGAGTRLKTLRAKR